VQEQTRSRRRAELVILVAVLVSIASSLALAITYFHGANVQLQGALLGGALGGIAVAFGVWGTRLVPVGGVVEDRPVLASTPADRAALVEDFHAGEPHLLRRKLLLAALGGAVASIGAVALIPLRSLGARPLGALRRTAWRSGVRLVDERGKPVHRDDLAVDSILTVFPEGFGRDDEGDSQTVLVRLRPGEIRPRRGRESWAPDGFVAYSKVCTHAGCPVGLYSVETHQLVCPCHQSLFDVTDGARPVYGPATRSLPQLPLAIDRDGYLVARADYDSPIGPGFWSWEG
jgi:ubiquinol-cytochrome c reductase iron-sulfur subunit